MRCIPMVLLLLAAPCLMAADIAPCLDCHRPGAREGLAPLLEGQHRTYLEIQLRRFKHHMRTSFPMQDLARGIGEEQVAELAAELGARPWQSAPTLQPAKAVKRGARLAERRDCRSCHGDELVGGGSIPRLAGQAAPYLRQQLVYFSAGERHHPPTGGGQRMEALREDQAADLAAWLSSLGAIPPGATGR
ncbi:c-type cytochrome [Pseudomarimonas salicorniae]|uniref:C-type cytochrome n=1 Tax=Pseudomarimonas salicorniae TaxID=2933270 RepID=A0ABT0GJP4_9GAMM|nr:c-type cytochrome [Lysobacter sp. CAU 1642]MCK7594772.1 c-type cytochrome [Lysobacter sp. CAU 1642]